MGHARSGRTSASESTRRNHVRDMRDAGSPKLLFNGSAQAPVTAALGHGTGASMGTAYLANAAMKAVFWGLLSFAAARGANAGPAPLPLEARLDTAQYVFVGQIAHIEKMIPVEGQIQMGLATIAVKEVFKGTPANVVKFLVPIAWPEHYQGSAGGPPFHVGDLGIWLVGVRDMAGTWGFYDVEARADVQRILKSLPGQKWSEPVHGLRARR